MAFHPHLGSASSPLLPSAPAIAGVVTVGGTATRTPGAGGPALGTYAYRDGVLVGEVSFPYTYEEEEDIGPILTWKDYNASGLSAASNALAYAGVAASLVSGNILRDNTNITLSGGDASAWADAGGFAFDTFDSLVAGPHVVYRQGRAANRFVAASTQAMQAHTNGAPGTLQEFNGTGSFHRFWILSPGTVTDTSPDIRDAECVVNDPAITAYGFGFQNIAGTIYCTGGLVSTAMRQPTNSVNNAVVAGEWYLVEEKFDAMAHVYSVRVGNNPAVSVNTVGVITPALTGRIVMGRNWSNQYANFTLAYVAGGLAVQSASVTADIRAYLTNTYLTEVEVQPTPSSLWGNVEGASVLAPNSYPDHRFSSDSMLVVDTDATTVRLAVGVEGTFGITEANWREHQIAIGVGVSPNIVWTTVPLTLVPAAYPLVPSDGYQRYIYAPVTLPGSGSRRIWIVNPTRLSTGTGAYVTVQSAMFNGGATVTPVAEPTNGCIIGTDAVDDRALYEYFGYYVLDGSLISAGGYDTARTNSAARWTRWATGKTAGTVVLWSPNTNDLRNRSGETNIITDLGLQARYAVEGVKAALAGWEVIYVTLLPLRAVDISLVTQTAVSAAESAGATTGGADYVFDGQTQFWNHTLGSEDGICLDNVHDYLKTMLTAATTLAARVTILNTGKPLLFACGGIMGAFPCRKGPDDEVFLPTNAQSMTALMRKSGW